MADEKEEKDKKAAPVADRRRRRLLSKETRAEVDQALAQEKQRDRVRRKRSGG